MLTGDLSRLHPQKLVDPFCIDDLQQLKKSDFLFFFFKKNSLSVYIYCADKFTVSDQVLIINSTENEWSGEIIPRL